MLTHECIEWHGPATVDDIITIAVEPMKNLVAMIDECILEEIDGEPGDIYYLNVTLGQLLDDFEKTLNRVGEEWQHDEDSRKDKAA